MNYTHEPERKNHRGLKFFGGLVVLIFVATLAWVVGNRLSDDALGVLAGAVCGVGAAIPTSLIIVAITRSRGSGRDDRMPYERPTFTQPMVMMVPPQLMSPGQGQFGQYQGQVEIQQGGPRTFRVVGDE